MKTASHGERVSLGEEKTLKTLVLTSYRGRRGCSESELLPDLPAHAPRGAADGTDRTERDGVKIVCDLGGGFD